jgi:hypothetical protein
MFYLQQGRGFLLFVTKARPASEPTRQPTYLKDIRSSFPGGKKAGTWSWPIAFIA